MDGVITVPVWLIAVIALGAGFFWLILTHGRKPFAVDQKPFDRLMEVVGKPYVLVVIMVAAALLIAAYVFYLNDIVVSVHHMVKSLRSESQAKEINSDTLRNLAQGSALLLGALVAASTLIFTLIRVWINERTTTATEEGLITDRINAAVASLGAEKTIKKNGIEETVPNIEVRMGAILALERIAKKNADVHIQIMEILTGYIRANAPIKPSQLGSMETFEKNYAFQHNIFNKVTRPDLHIFQYNQPNHELPNPPSPPRNDIQLALTVIGRRPPKRIALERAHRLILDLRHCNFSLVDLSRLNFAHAQFTNSLFLNAELGHAQLNNANLVGAQLNNANLEQAQLNNANLVGAQLNKANLLGAQLNKANLEGAQLNNAYLTCAQLNNAALRNTQLNDADLMGAQLNNTDLQNAQLNNADLQNAELNNAELTEAQLNNANLQNAQLNNAYLGGAQLNNAYLGDAKLENVKIFTHGLLRGAGVKNMNFATIEVTQDQIDTVFGDGSVTLPKTLTRPAHWPKEDLNWRVFENQWRKWQKTLPPLDNN